MTRRAAESATRVEEAALSLRIRDVFRIGDDESAVFLRILWIEAALGVTFVLPLGVNGVPRAMSTDELADGIVGGSATWTDDHPFKRAPLIAVPAQLDRPATDMAVVVRPRNAPRVLSCERELVKRHGELIAPLIALAHDGSLFRQGYLEAVRLHALASGSSHATVVRVIRTWFEFGMVDAALGSQRHRCGGKGKSRTYTGSKPGRKPKNGESGVALNPEILEALAWAVKWLRSKPFQPYENGFIEMNNRFFPSGTQRVGEVDIPDWLPSNLRPTIWQFTRYVRRQLPDRERKRKRRGEKQYQLNVRPVLGDTGGRSYKPGSMFHLDSSPMAFNLLDRFIRNRNLGQPRLYFVIDDFSWAIMGKLVALGAENTPDALLACADAFVGFVRAPRALKGESQRADVPKFACWELFSDKGSSFTSELNHQVFNRLRGSVSNPEGGRPDARGGAEQRFNMANMFLNWLPGAISKRRRGRADKKRGGDALFTMPEYEVLIDEFILHHNSTFRPPRAPRESFGADGLPLVAFDLMLWGMKNRGAPDRFSSDDIRLCLYPQVLAKVADHGRGLKVCGAYYETSHEVPGLRLDRDAPSGEWLVLRDPYRIGRAWLLVDQGSSVVELTLVSPREVADYTMAEWDASRAAESAGRLAAEPTRLKQKAASLRVLNQTFEGARSEGGSGRARAASGTERGEEARLQAQNTRERISAYDVATAGPMRDPGKPSERAEPLVNYGYDDDELELFEQARAELQGDPSDADD